MSSEKPNQQYKPVHTNKVGGSPYTGVTGWIDNRLPIIRMFKHEYLDFQVPKILELFLEFRWHSNDLFNTFDSDGLIWECIISPMQNMPLIL